MIKELLKPEAEEKETVEGEISRAEEREDQSKEVIETESGRFHILYNIHGGIAESKPTPAERLDKKDALILEGAGISENFKDKRVARRIIDFQRLTANINRDIVRRAIKDCVPIFFVDASDKAWENYKNSEIKQKIAAGIEGAMGVSVVIAGSIKSSEQKISRRDFIKRLFAYGMGGYLSTPLIKEFSAPWAAEKRKVRQFGKFSDTIHPEFRTFAVEGRNHLIAQKSETVAKILEKENNKKPEVAISIGAAHYDLEDALKISDEERIEKLKSYEDISLEDEALIIRIDFEKSPDQKGRTFKVTLMHDPKLKSQK